MTDKRIEEIKARVEAATAGPWQHKLYLGNACYLGKFYPNGDLMCHLGDIFKSKDGKFMAHSRDDIPYLLAELSKAEKKVKFWKMVAELCSVFCRKHCDQPYISDRSLLKDCLGCHKKTAAEELGVTVEEMEG